jgi:hypothetical protein
MGGSATGFMAGVFGFSAGASDSESSTLGTATSLAPPYGYTMGVYEGKLTAGSSSRAVGISGGLANGKAGRTGGSIISDLGRAFFYGHDSGAIVCLDLDWSASAGPAGG